jgi:hypothetical protein
MHNGLKYFMKLLVCFGLLNSWKQMIGLGKIRKVFAKELSYSKEIIEF